MVCGPPFVWCHAVLLIDQKIPEYEVHFENEVYRVCVLRKKCPKQCRVKALSSKTASLPLKLRSIAGYVAIETHPGAYVHTRPEI